MFGGKTELKGEKTSGGSPSAFSRLGTSVQIGKSMSSDEVLSRNLVQSPDMEETKRTIIEGIRRGSTDQNMIPPLRRRVNFEKLPNGSAKLRESHFEEMGLSHIMDTTPEKCFDDFTTLACALTGSAHSAIWFTDEDRTWMKSNGGLPWITAAALYGSSDSVSSLGGMTPRGPINSLSSLASMSISASTSTSTSSLTDTTSLCALIISKPTEVTEISDFSNFSPQSGMSQNRIAWCAGFPIFLRDIPVGVLCVMDEKPRKLTAQESENLKMLAGTVSCLIELRTRDSSNAQQLRDTRLDIELKQKEIDKLNAKLMDNSMDSSSPTGRALYTTPARRSIGILQEVRENLDSLGQAAVDAVIDVIASQRIYDNDLSEALSRANGMDEITKEFIATQMLLEDAGRVKIKKTLSEPTVNTLLGPESAYAARLSPAPRVQTAEDLVSQVKAFEAPEGLIEWEYDIFPEFPGKDLMTVTYYCIASHGIFDRLSIDQKRLLRFLKEIQQGYKPECSYHNSLHAMDVVLNVNYFITNGDFGVSLTDIQIFAILIAAAIHDYRHPGVNNTFLIRTCDDLALESNDISVLENFHLKESFRLLKDDRLNFMKNFPREAYTEIRKTIIELVLATDMSLHVPIVSQFQNKMSFGLDPSNVTEDRMLIMKMAMKCADIGNPAKPMPIYRKWIALVMATSI
eukprot:TRINITY_DN726_c4_g1_i1.p1 TRINITY_DN726_c4_g1~~TRINITY_DN726_c4_g1_i1.p1  ORF type:complete len:686 (+),score=192.58 TRINITY_DN726_c4_g1_i1:158-2215(+)